MNSQEIGLLRIRRAVARKSRSQRAQEQPWLTPQPPGCLRSFGAALWRRAGADIDLGDLRCTGQAGRGARGGCGHRRLDDADAASPAA